MKKSVTLNAAGIDSVSEWLYQELTSSGAERRDAIRLRLSAEEILELWMGRLSRESDCICTTETRFGKKSIHIRVRGEKTDPNTLTGENEEESGELLYSSLLAQAGLSLVYSYKDGENVLSVYLPRKSSVNPMIWILTAIAAAVLLGVAYKALPEAVQTFLPGITDPLFNCLLGALQALAGPMILLAVCWGILSVGDVHVLGKIGRVILSRAALFTYISMGIALLATFWLFNFSGAGAAGDSGDLFSQIYQMILDIVPTNIISPFLEGNALQIIFMGICIGVALLFLGERVSAVSSVVEQLNEVVQFLMGLFGKLIPLFVFLSVFSLFASDALGSFGAAFKGVLVIVVCSFILPVAYAFAASLRLKTSFGLMLRKILPIFMVGITTASSSAALAGNLETCEKKLGIPGKITGFAVPLGQVIFMPATAIGFSIMALCMAESYGVSVTPSWMVINVMVSGLLAIAAPPVPGGAMTCYTILFAQLGIPSEAITLAIAADIILDFVATASSLATLQMELVLASNQLGMLDKKILNSKEL